MAGMAAVALRWRARARSAAAGARATQRVAVLADEVARRALGVRLLAARRAAGQVGLDRAPRGGLSSPSTYGARCSSRSPQFLISSAMLADFIIPCLSPSRGARRPRRRARSPSDSARRPREMRDITVPIGTSSTVAISAYDSSSTSRSQTA